MIEVPGGPGEHAHIYCSEECRGDTPTGFACFHDGCDYECCGCGACCDPAACPETGQGHVWHQ